MLEWVGGEFDPDVFDLDEVNTELQSKPRHDLLYASASFRRLDFRRSKPALSPGHPCLKMLSCTISCSVLEYRWPLMSVDFS